MMMVNHEDKAILFDGKFETIHRGMCITSIRKLSDRWGWSTKKTSNFLNELEKQMMIRQERTTKRTIVSITKYNDYQDSRNSKGNTEETLRKHRRNTEETKQYTIKNDKDTRKNIYAYAHIEQEPLEEGDEYLPDDYWEEA